MKPDVEIVGLPDEYPKMNIAPNFDLRKRCDPVIWGEDTFRYVKQVVEWMDKLVAKYEDVNPLAGLAANQTVVPGITRVHTKRIMIIRQTDDSWRNYINPVIVYRSDQVEWETEGCGSLPGVVVRVKRNHSITMRYQTLEDNGNTQHTMTFAGSEARVIQHEVDHLDGILITDRNDPINFLAP